MRFPALFSRTSTLTLTTLLAGAVLSPLCGLVQAQAATSAPAAPQTLEQKALTVAQHQVGKPVRAGAIGPDAFDASGLTFFAFKQAGKLLPHSALTQYRAIRHLSLAQAQPGDLFLMSHSGSSTDASRIDHVGIYAGSNAWYVASKPGSTVHRQNLWTKNVWVGQP